MRRRETCSRCGCCATRWVDCRQCADVADAHRCDDESCECSMIDELESPCEICSGTGGWPECDGDCDAKGRHPGKAAAPPAPSRRARRSRRP